MAIALTPHEDEEEVEYDEDGNVIVGSDEESENQTVETENIETSDNDETSEN